MRRCQAANSLQLGSLSMRLLPSKFWARFRRQKSRTNHPGSTRRLEFENLEERCLLATASGVITGVAYIDANRDGIHQASETTVKGISVVLTGTTTQNTPVSSSTVTDD